MERCFMFSFFYKTSNASHCLSLLSALFALLHRLLRKNIINVLNSPTYFKFVCVEIFEISLRWRYRTPKASLTLRLRSKEIFWPDSYDVQVSNPIKNLNMDLNSSKGKISLKSWSVWHGLSTIVQSVSKMTPSWRCRAPEAPHILRPRSEEISRLGSFSI